jgi:hypothetical protein
VSDPQPDTARTALVAAARDLGRDLRRAKELLSRLEPHLLARVEIRMGTLLERGIRQAAATLRLAEGDGYPADVWAEVHALRWTVDGLLQECLILVKGNSDRKLGFDDGYCDLADALVDELVARTPIGHWSSFTVVGRSDQYSRASRVIQLRFPPSSIWQLPLVAHELGHFVAPVLVTDQGLRSGNPLTELGRTLGDDSPQSWAQLEELFADAFATRLLGPAYGYACVLAAFDPLLAEVPSPTHPAAQQRVDIITAMLERTRVDPMPWLAGRIREIWADLVKASGGQEGRTPVGTSPFAGALVDLLDDFLPISAYTGWSRAEQIAARFLGEGAADVVRPSLADVLNGAWQARLNAATQGAVDDVAVQAEKLCRAMADGGS